ncbi:MAG TPA: response regulator transcription factor [Flavobacteriales bacterium]|nr:response regulator transcription factor [Flavobacteriales bacterium]
MPATTDRTILVVEDDPRLSRSLCRQLEEAGYATFPVFDGKMAQRAIRNSRFHLVLLDLSLPEVDGFKLTEEIRRRDRNTPVIILTAFGDMDSKLNAFQLGADDYLVKPVHFQELLAKVKVFLKRAESHPLEVEHIEVADLRIDLQRKTVERAGQAIELTPKEFHLLACLARNKGRVLSKDDLAEQVWDNAYGVSNNTIEVYISFLRSKVDKGHEQPLIHTKHGFGYALDDHPA